MLNANLFKSITIPKRTINIVLILATLVAAVYYFYHHQHLLSQLKHLNPALVISILGLYILLLGVLISIYWATMKLTSTKIDLKPNSLINIYSLFMNFFIPGQTGPAFRAYYMKKNYGLKYGNYTLATLLYYLIYGVTAVIFIVVGSQPYYVSLPLVFGTILMAVLAVIIYLKKHKSSRLKINLNTIATLCLVTLAQFIVQTLIYFIEVHSVHSKLALSQMITYAGTANLALFVALTPGAIGIREGFLILSERLNHLSSSTIVLANVIDRSIYIVFLLLLGLIIVSLKVKDKLTKSV